MKITASILYWHARPAIAWLLAGIAYIYFASTNANFLNLGNQYALIQLFSTLMLVAAGLAVVMITAEFDLSIAGTFPLAGLVAVQASNMVGVLAAVALAIVVGAAVGALNGWITGKFGIPSLAVTVATMVLTIGVGYAITGSQLVTMTDYTASLKLTQRVLGVFSMVSLLQIALALLAYLFIKMSWRGRFVYAVGSDSARARASALPVRTTLIFVFVLCAVFSSVAGALQGVSLATGQAGSDDSFLLQCATAALIGGVALTGGRGALVGVFGGAFLLTVLTNGLGLAGVNSALIQLVNGIVLAAVVLVDRPLSKVIDRRLRAELPMGGTPTADEVMSIAPVLSPRSSA